MTNVVVHNPLEVVRKDTQPVLQKIVVYIVPLMDGRESAYVIDKRRGHGVVIVAETGQSLRDVARGEYAYRYDYIERSEKNPDSWGYFIGSGKDEEWIPVFSMEKFNEKYGENARTTQIPLKRGSDNKYYWNSREALRRVFAPRTRPSRTGWYTVG